MKKTYENQHAPKHLKHPIPVWNVALPDSPNIKSCHRTVRLYSSIFYFSLRGCKAKLSHFLMKGGQTFFSLALSNCMSIRQTLPQIFPGPPCTFFTFMYSTYYTSSTAQGGGGSFKNRKPIGELGCCESGMAERSH